MSELSEIVSITITQDTVGLTQPGFGTPLVLSHNATFPERVRFYSSTLEAAVDWSTSSPEYLAIRAALSQSPHVEQVAVGRTNVKPTQQYTIGQAALRNSDSSSYKINVAGQGVTASTASYTSDASATAAEIHNGLVTSLNAVVGKNFTATFGALSFVDFTFTADNATEQLTATAHGLQTGDGPVRASNSGGGLPSGLLAATDYWAIRVDANTFKLASSLANALAGTAIDITTNGTGTQTVNHQSGTVSPSASFLVTGNSPGNWFSLEVVDATALSTKQTHADPGLSAELDAIALENNTWYCLLTNYNSTAYVEAASAWIEAQTKIYVFDDVNTDSINVAVGSGTDAGAALHTLAPMRTAGMYHQSPVNMASAAWAGRVLPIEPGGETWMFKTLSGVVPSKLTTTNRNNLRARNMNWFQTVAGRNIMQTGSTFNGNYLDVVRGLDWLENDMTVAVFTTLASNDKISFDDPGISTVENDIVASLDRAVQRRILRATPRPLVVVPLAADVADVDKALRTLPDITFSAELAGAIHKVIVHGVVSV
jgi:hypothetical protein